MTQEQIQIESLEEQCLVVSGRLDDPLYGADYPVEKVSCYVCDGGSAMPTFESRAETFNK
ncbi:Cellulose synthase A catalytic subunit 4 [UDP-forming] [Acorus calamus]|uniref:Cellulose synthase A catalytic subunit 4 [UDP-forming] n=1 Tax=Acorus calamus TaxID=4465 RepID=A0AAV9CSH0_ACOCL|nr:Cellulose synthase A catalytic subunit 4 [UDP-forming] [Acorus calamus]